MGVVGIIYIDWKQAVSNHHRSSLMNRANTNSPVLWQKGVSLVESRTPFLMRSDQSPDFSLYFLFCSVCILQPGRHTNLICRCPSGAGDNNAKLNEQHLIWLYLVTRSCQPDLDKTSVNILPASHMATESCCFSCQKWDMPEMIEKVET